MSPPQRNPDERFYHSLLTPLHEHRQWVLTEKSDTVATAAARAANSKLGELFYTHQSTGARLHVTIPDESTSGGALEAILTQPLDPNIRQKNGPETFTGKLSAAQQTIAERHGTAYITPEADPVVIVTVAVPIQYDHCEWGETITATSTISKAINQLHTTIRQAVQP